MKDTKLSLALLDQIVICGQCGALFLALGWSNEKHLAWHQAQNGEFDLETAIGDLIEKRERDESTAAEADALAEHTAVLREAVKAVAEARSSRGPKGDNS